MQKTDHGTRSGVKYPDDERMLDQTPAGFLRTPDPDEPSERDAVAVAVNRFRSTGRVVRIPLLAWSEAGELFGLSEADAEQAVRHFRHLVAVPS